METNNNLNNNLINTNNIVNNTASNQNNMTSNNTNKTNKKLIIIIIIMSLIIVGLTGYIVYDYMSSKENTKTEEKNNNNTDNKEENNNNNNDTKEDNKKDENNTSNDDNNSKDENNVIETKITKKIANEQLQNSIGTAYYAFGLKESKIGRNIFDDDFAKLYLAYKSQIRKDGYISEECYDGEGATGCAAIDLKKYEEHYYNLFGEKFEDNKYEKLNKKDSFYGYRDGQFFGSFPTGLQGEMILKASNIVERQKTIEVDVDIIDTTDDDELYNEYYNANVTQYDTKAVVAKYKLTLGKNTNGTHKIISFIRVN